MPTSRAGSRRGAARPAPSTGGGPGTATAGPVERRGSRSGFTLLEILVTVAIIAIVSALAAPAIAGRLLESPLDRTTRLLKGMLEEARATAATRGEPVTVLWRPESRRFSLRGSRGEHVLAIPGGVEVSAVGLMRTSGDPASPEAREGIVFFPLGGSSGGRVELQAGGEAAGLEPDRLTGTVHLERRWAHRP